MKKVILLLIFFTNGMNGFSQKEYKIYSSIQSRVIPFIDSIFKIPFDRTYREYSLKYKSTPYTVEPLRVFGDTILLVDSPDSSKVVKKLAFGETVYCPYFYTDGPYNDLRNLGWEYKLDDIGDGMGARTYFRFVFLEDGTFGFINEFDIFHNIATLPSTDLLFIKESYKKAIVKKDFSKAFYFTFYDYQYSEDCKSMIYSSKGEKYPQPDSSFVYLYELSTWKNKKIGFGYSPVFLDNQIVYWSGFIDDTNPEEVHLYDIASGSNKVIFQVPDSITLWGCDPDGCGPSTIEVERTGNEDEIILGLCFIHDYESPRYFKFRMNIKGEINKVEKVNFDISD
jgi:hypothetical protein